MQYLLEGILEALSLEGEVITTPFTFASTTHAIVRSGLVPVFCDVDPATYTLDPGKIEALITEKTCAIVPVHVYGSLCDVDAIEAWKKAQIENELLKYNYLDKFGNMKRSLKRDLKVRESIYKGTFKNIASALIIWDMFRYYMTTLDITSEWNCML